MKATTRTAAALDTDLYFQGRRYMTANADRHVHLQATDGKSLCDYQASQLYPTSRREATHRRFCEVCLAKVQG
jgi:hypothetical protein